MVKESKDGSQLKMEEARYQSDDSDFQISQISTLSTPKLSSGRHGRSSAVSSASSSPSSSKLQRKDSSKGKVPRCTGAKWHPWEENLIYKAIIESGEKLTAWNGLTQEINFKRGADGELDRTVNSVKLHWKVAMKPKWL